VALLPIITVLIFTTTKVYSRPAPHYRISDQGQKMGMRDILLQPLLAGLSMGLFCATTCLPVIAPYLAAEQRDAKAIAGTLLQFILGRLGGYILFGVVSGYLGERWTGEVFHWFAAVSMILLSFLLLLYTGGVMNPSRGACERRLRSRRFLPWMMGFLMGVNICPPFLLSVVYVFTLHSVFKGVVYFLVFFAATTVYFLPLFFLGLLGRLSEFRAAARVSAALVGALFMAYGVYEIVRGAPMTHGP
jgi:sulfite exporter TauE/SafE